MCLGLPVIEAAASNLGMARTIIKVLNRRRGTHGNEANLPAVRSSVMQKDSIALHAGIRHRLDFLKRQCNDLLADLAFSIDMSQYAARQMAVFMRPKEPHASLHCIYRNQMIFLIRVFQPCHYAMRLPADYMPESRCKCVRSIWFVVVIVVATHLQPNTPA
jgi:hypothetical protein